MILELHGVRYVRLYTKIIDSLLNKGRFQKSIELSTSIDVTKVALLSEYDTMIVMLQQLDGLTLHSSSDDNLKEWVKIAKDDSEFIKRLKNQSITFVEVWKDIETHYTTIINKSRVKNAMKASIILCDKGSTALQDLRELLFSAVEMNSKIEHVLETAQKQAIK